MKKIKEDWKKLTDEKKSGDALNLSYMGYPYEFRGFYNKSNCDGCYDYCRWEGSSGAGGDPEKSWWSCIEAGNNYTTETEWTHTRADCDWDLPFKQNENVKI